MLRIKSELAVRTLARPAHRMPEAQSAKGVVALKEGGVLAGAASEATGYPP